MVKFQYKIWSLFQFRGKKAPIYEVAIFENIFCDFFKYFFLTKTFYLFPKFVAQELEG